MKKTLLSVALGLACAGTMAANDYYTMTYEGKTLENGETITITSPSVEEGDKGNYSIDITVNILKGDEETPTFIEASFDYANPDADNKGAVQFCSNPGSCYPPLFTLPGNLGYMRCNQDFGWWSGDAYQYMIHINEVPQSKTLDQTYVLWNAAYTGEEINVAGDYGFDKLDGTDMKIYIRVCDPSVLSVDGLEADTKAEYYTIDGLRVENPENGLVIVKKGDKIFKQIIRK